MPNSERSTERHGQAWGVASARMGFGAMPEVRRSGDYRRLRLNSRKEAMALLLTEGTAGGVVSAAGRVLPRVRQDSGGLGAHARTVRPRASAPEGNPFAGARSRSTCVGA